MKTDIFILSREKQLHNRKIALFGLCAASCAVLVVFLIHLGLTRQSGAVKATSIDNFYEYYENTPSKLRADIEQTINKAITKNSGLDAVIPKSGALIRKNTVNASFDEKENVYQGSFIVDIASVRQSYVINYKWTEAKKSNINMGTPTEALCPKADDLIYEEFVCTDAGEDEFWNKENNFVITGLTYLTKQGIPQNIVTKIADVSSQFIGNSYPSTLEASLVGFSKINSHSYEITLSLDTLKKLKISIELINEMSLKLSIHDEVYGKLLSYDDSIYSRIYNYPNSLTKRHLPHQDKTNDDTIFTVLAKGDNRYEIAITSCGDQSKKDEALSRTREWLKSINYNPEDFEFVLPNYCDDQS